MNNAISIQQSDTILAADDLYKLQEEYTSYGNAFTYQMTEGELAWLDFVRGKYSIADWIDSRLEGDLLTFNDCESMSQALADDGIDCKAVCLSDDTALQRLFFWLSVDVTDYCSELG